MEISKNLAVFFSLTIVMLSGCGGSTSSTDSNNAPPPQNSAPVAQSDVVVLTSNKKAAIDVLANDSDNDGDNLTLTKIITGPESGTAIIEDNQIFFTPELNSISVQSLTYEVSDGLQTSQAEVEITIHQQLTMSGKVPNYLLTSPSVIITIGNNETTTEVDIDGNFSTSITLTTGDEVISIEASGISAGGSKDLTLNNLISANNILASSYDLDEANYQVLLNELTTAEFILAISLLSENSGAEDLDKTKAQLLTSTKLELASLIALIAEDNVFILPDDKTLSALFRTESNKIDSVLDDYLGSLDLLADNGEREQIYHVESSRALSNLLNNSEIIKPIDEQMFAGLSFSVTAESQPNLLPLSGKTSHFSQNGTGNRFPNYNEYSPAVQHNFSWQITNGKLIKSFDIDTYDTFPIFISQPFDELSYVYGFSSEAVNELNDLVDQSGWFSSFFFYLTKGISSETYTLLSSKDGRIELHKETITETIASNDENNLPFELPEMRAVSKNTSATEIEHYSNDTINLFEDYSLEDIQGGWLLYLESEFEYSYSSDSPLTALAAGKVVITNDYAQDLFTGKEFEVTINDGVISLSEGNTSFTFKPYKQESNTFLATVEKLVDGQVIYSVVKQIARANETTSELTTSLITELPIAKLSYLGGTSPKNYRDNQLDLKKIFGFQFNQDGTLRYGIRSYSETEYNNGSYISIDKFSIPQPDWYWIADDDKIEMTNVSSYADKKRVWYPISTDDKGRTIVLDYSYWIVDRNFNGTFDDDFGSYEALPRLMVIKNEDLRNWHDAWQNTSY